MRVLADGRVRRTRSEWQKIMRRFEKSGLTVAAFCGREEISASAFSDWRRKLSVKGVKKPSFVELTPSAPPPRASLPARGEFELSLPGGVVLRWKA
jgi:transposase-like protein